MKLASGVLILSLAISPAWGADKAAPAEPVQPPAAKAQAAKPKSADSLTGRQIVDKAKELQESPSEFEAQTMTLIDKAGSKEVRTVRRFARKEAGDRYKYLVVFLTPPGVKGVALLTWQNPGGEDDQWLYMPAFKNLKRVAKGSKKNYFMSTDFTYEDLVSEDRDKFRYTRLADDAGDGSDAYVVEVVPTDTVVAEESGYKRRVVWIRKDTFMAVRTEYYDKHDRLIKRQTVGDLVNVSGSVWRGKSTIMDNFQEKHKTEILIEDRSLDPKDVPEENFQHRYITSGKHTR